MKLRKFCAVATVILAALTCSITQETSDERHTVAFLVLGPYPDDRPNSRPDWDGGPALIPAARLAADLINNRTDLLPGYRLKLLEGDSGCNILPKAALSFVSNVFHNQSTNVVGIIGPGCSAASLFLGTLGTRKEVSLIQISPSATSPDLTDIVRYNNTFRMLSSSTQYVDTFCELMKQNGWTNVAALYDANRPYFRSTFDRFYDSLNTSPNMNVGYFSPVGNSYIPLSSIEAQYRVVFVFAGASLSRTIMCLAYHSQPPLLYPVYQWIFHDKTIDQFLMNVNFTFKGTFYNCSKQVMAKAMKGVILNIYRFRREDSSTMTDVDLVYDEYQELYKQYLNDTLQGLPENQRTFEDSGEDFAVAYYDATWAMALSLNQSLSNLSLPNYSFGNPNDTAIIKSHLIGLEFEGLLGRIKFRNKTQDPVTTIDIHQFGDDDMLVGYFDGTNLVLNDSTAKFVTGTFDKKVISVHPAATAVILSLSILVTLLVVGLHLIYIFYRKEKSIKASSPNLSHLIFSGCYLILLQCFLVVYEFSGWTSGTNPQSRKHAITVGVICNAYTWCRAIGLSLVLGTLCGQLWRIYRIFNQFSSRTLHLSDFTLTTFVICLLLLDLSVLITWTGYDPLLANIQLQEIRHSENPSEEPVISIRVLCNCEYYEIWMLLVWGINILVSVCVVVLSTLNRHVSRKHFHMTKSINIMVYFMMLSFLLLIGLSFILEHLDIHYMYILWQLSFLSMVVLVCVFVFIPHALPVIYSRVLYLFRKV